MTEQKRQMWWKANQMVAHNECYIDGFVALKMCVNGAKLPNDRGGSAIKYRYNVAQQFQALPNAISAFKCKREKNVRTYARTHSM